VSAKRTERLLNLTICLMAARRPLTKAEIRAALTDYRDSVSDDAFERMFERDKDDLREMGIPLVTESRDPLFDDELGYRIDPHAYALPQIDVTPDEMAVLTLAARAWEQGALGPAATAALRKLEIDNAAGTDPDRLGIETRLATSEAAFAPLYSAVRDRRPVRFDYRTPRADEPGTRHVEPWGVVSWHGRWYLVGHDLDRDDTRVFRLSRIDGEVRTAGPAGSVTVPDGIDVASVLQTGVPVDADRTASVRVRTGSAHLLRRTATSVAPDPDHPGSEILTVPYWDEEAFAGDVVGNEAVALAPAELRDACLRRLHALAATDAAGDGTRS
jgi:proteasome accessory factor B